MFSPNEHLQSPRVHFNVEKSLKYTKHRFKELVLIVRKYQNHIYILTYISPVPFQESQYALHQSLQCHLGPDINQQVVH